MCLLMDTHVVHHASGGDLSFSSRQYSVTNICDVYEHIMHHTLQVHILIAALHYALEAYMTRRLRSFSH